jgi:hypothetical protein
MKTKLLLIATATLLITGTAATVSLADAQKGDRGLTAERALGAAEKIFTHLDADSDGILSTAELEAGPKRGMRGEKADGDEASMGKEKGKGKGKRKGKHDHRMVRIFLGEEGLTAGVTLDDMQAKISSAFAELDADASGTLTRDEIRPAMKAMHEARKS